MVCPGLAAGTPILGGKPSFRDAFALPSSKIDGPSTNGKHKNSEISQ